MRPTNLERHRDRKAPAVRWSALLDAAFILRQLASLTAIGETGTIVISGGVSGRLAYLGPKAHLGISTILPHGAELAGAPLGKWHPAFVRKILKSSDAVL